MGRVFAAIGFGIMLLGLWIGGVGIGLGTGARSSGADTSSRSVSGTATVLRSMLKPTAIASPTSTAAPRPAGGARSEAPAGRLADSGTLSQSQTSTERAPARAGTVSAPTPSPNTPPWMHCDAQPRVSSSASQDVTMLIPRLGIWAPVYDRGVDDQGNMIIVPGYAVTHLSYTARLGTWDNYVVYGHDDIEHCVFRYLSSLNIGDAVEFYSGTTRYTYVVTDRRLVSPTDVQVLDHTDEPIATLISCYPVGIDSQRIVVISNLVSIDDDVSQPG